MFTTKIQNVHQRKCIDIAEEDLYPTENNHACCLSLEDNS